MRDWTEQEEREMIQRAKGGEPEANFELSQWARQRAEEEPDEPRWNRLAAKCLMKAAQAGYAPAQEQMEQLLAQQQAASRQTAAETPEKPAGRTAKPADRKKTESAPQNQDSRSRRNSLHLAPQPEQEEPEGEYEYEDEEESDDETPASRVSRRAQSPGGLIERITERFSQWDDTQWKRMQISCVIVCVVLAVLIVTMLVTRPGKKEDTPEEPPVPTAEAVEPQATPTAQPEEESYPGSAILAAIEEADLDVRPNEEDYVTEPTTAVVSVGNVLHLRKGPGTNFGTVADMPDDTRLEIYARKDSWVLVLYEGDTWGWCSKDYLLEDATPVTSDGEG